MKKKKALIFGVNGQDGSYLMIYTEINMKKILLNYFMEMLLTACLYYK